MGIRPPLPSPQLIATRHVQDSPPTLQSNTDSVSKLHRPVVTRHGVRGGRHARTPHPARHQLHKSKRQWRGIVSM